MARNQDLLHTQRNGNGPHGAGSAMLKPDAPPLLGEPGIAREDPARIAQLMGRVRFRNSPRAAAANRRGRRPDRVEYASAASPLVDL